MRTVVDTNVVVSSYLFPHSAPGRVVELWNDGVFELLISGPLVGEYHRVLQYPHIRPRIRMADEELARSIERFRTQGTSVVPNMGLRVIAADPDDDIVVATAVAGEADYIVSGDRHLLELGEYAGIRVVAPVAFLAILEHDL